MSAVSNVKPSKPAETYKGGQSVVRSAPPGISGNGEHANIKEGKLSRKVISDKVHKYLKSRSKFPSGWEYLPLDILVKIYSFLNFWDRARASRVCSHWNSVFHIPELWRKFDFEVTQETTSYLKSTPPGLIKQVLQQHKEHLRSVSISVDSHPKSAEIACDILSQLVNCSIKTLELMSTAKPTFMINKDNFVSAFTVVVVNSKNISSLALSDTPVDDPSLEVLATMHQNSLTLLNMESCPNASPQGITFVADLCHQLHQLTIDYSHMSDELLSSLCSEEHVKLKYLRLNITRGDDAEGQLRPISQKSWNMLARHSPDLILVMNFYLLNDKDYESFFKFEIPVTHVYFGRSVSREVLRRLGVHCPSLTEIVICANGHEPLDQELLEIAKQCKELQSLGLGECEVHCSAMVKFAEICGKRLSQLFIREEVLVADDQCGIDEMRDLVSEFLGRQWYPESMPFWD